jgi:hypothetical protein
MLILRCIIQFGKTNVILFLGGLMKRYIQIMLIALVAQCGLSNVVYGMKIVPTGEGENSIINAIKKYSNFTEADVKQYKALKFGGLGTYAAFLLGAVSSIGAGAKTYQYAESIKGIVPEFVKTEQVPSWMKSPWALAVLGAAGTGLFGRQLLKQPVRREIENNILKKIQTFIGVCQVLEVDTPVSSGYRSIFNYTFSDLQSLRRALPRTWPFDDDIAIYTALNNLIEQGRRARLLLNDLQFESEKMVQLSVLLSEYYNPHLLSNLKLYDSVIDANKRKEIQDAELSLTKAQTNLAQAGTYAIYGSMAKGAVSTFWNGIKELYAHPEILALIGFGWVTTKYLAPSMIKSK